MALSPVPGVPGLYVSGLLGLKRKQALADANITHIVTVLRGPFTQHLYAPYKHLIIEVDDLEDENLLEHFNESNEFVHHALLDGGGVLIHCAMGKSRSITLVMSYLLTYPPSTLPSPLTPSAALSAIRNSRPMAEPNPGFATQIDLFYKLGCPADVTATAEYKRWLFDGEVKTAVAAGTAPQRIQFSDDDLDTHKTPLDGEAVAGQGKEYRCRKCRHLLAHPPHIVAHLPPPASTQKCAHIPLAPLKWMAPALTTGALDGRLNCPRCGAGVGRFAWQGLKCSCGRWLTPGITVLRAKVDEGPWRPRGRNASTNADLEIGIRRPPAVSNSSGP